MTRDTWPMPGLAPTPACDRGWVDRQLRSPDMETNLQMIAALPNQVITQVLNHINTNRGSLTNMMLRCGSTGCWSWWTWPGTRPSASPGWTRCSAVIRTVDSQVMFEHQVLDWLHEGGLVPGFEIMGNPGGVFGGCQSLLLYFLFNNSFFIANCQ